MPCHPARARKLLKKGRAVVHHHTPFAIRLTERTAEQSHVDGVELSIDPGSKHTGMSIFATTNSAPGGTARRGLFALEVAHRGAKIRDKLTQRAHYRRNRRSRNLRYRAPRFNNRTKPAGWLPPSLRHRVDTTASWVTRLTRWAPVRAIHIERVAFDVNSMTAGRSLVEGVEYQHGTLAGTETREYLLAKWNHRCAYCGTSGVPLNIDHIHPKSCGGSNRISNLTLACIPCNQAKNNQAIKDFLAHKPDLLAGITAQAKAPLRDAAAMNATRYQLARVLQAIHPDLRCSSGGRTKWNRQRLGLPKTHTLDALCVGVLDHIARYPGSVLAVAATGRGSYTRTRTDKYGFPRLYLPRTKTVHGFQTGDLAKATVPTGKRTGTHTGRIAIRTTGRFNIRTSQGLVQGIHHRHFRLLQRADGYAHASKQEGGGASSPA